MWPSISSRNVAPMFCPPLCNSFVIKIYDYGQDFHFYHKTKQRAVGKNIGAMFPEGIQGHMQSLSESEVKQQKAKPFNYCHEIHSS